jgi:hypothetical protein
VSSKYLGRSDNAAMPLRKKSATAAGSTLAKAAASTRNAGRTKRRERSQSAES